MTTPVAWCEGYRGNATVYKHGDGYLIRFFEAAAGGGTKNEHSFQAFSKSLEDAQTTARVITNQVAACNCHVVT